MKNWMDQIDSITQKFTETYKDLNSSQLNWKPNSGTWSIAQNVHHLITINSSYFPIIDSIRKCSYKTPFIGRLGFMVSFCEKTVLKAVQPDRKKKMKTFDIWEPSKSEISQDILEQFVKHQVELKQLIESSADLIEKGQVISSPANKNIVYKLEIAFEIIIQHELRHFEQSREVFELLKKSDVY